MTTITPADVLASVHPDALKAYRDLSPYRIVVALQDDGWHIDYELANPQQTGGGPHYVVDAETDTIVSKRYEQ